MTTVRMLILSPYLSEEKEIVMQIMLVYGPKENNPDVTIRSFFHDVPVPVEAAFLNSPGAKL